MWRWRGEAMGVVEGGLFWRRLRAMLRGRRDLLGMRMVGVHLKEAGLGLRRCFP